MPLLKFLIISSISSIFLLQNITSASEIVFNASKATDSCKDKWTSRGVLDENMFSYCMNQQTDGYKEAIYLTESKYQNIPLIEEIVTYAMNRWLTRKEYLYDMVSYEIENQSEAYLDLEWDLNNGKISISLLEKCMDKWITLDEPLWDMVSYCTKNN